MKLFFFERECAVGAPGKGRLALTLVEMMITVGIFSLSILALVYVHIFGLRQAELIGSKLGASYSSRKGFDLLARDIRSAKIVDIGNGSQTTFTVIPSGTLQKGNAMQLHLTTNTTTYIQYYFVTNAGTLCRMHSGDGANYTVIASNLVETLYFLREDFRGSNQTSLTQKGVIHTTLKFNQFQYPMTKVGTNGYYYDSYKLEFRFSPHVQDGVN
jgi:Tfp pilus assembly protein PilW